MGLGVKLERCSGCTGAGDYKCPADIFVRRIGGELKSLVAVRSALRGELLLIPGADTTGTVLTISCCGAIPQPETLGTITITEQG